MIKNVVITKNAAKQIKLIPKHITNNLLLWIDNVENIGLDEVKKIKGYHDEPLQGKRLGQRSVRLSLSYRMIYFIKVLNDHEVEIQFISIEEITKHNY